MVAIGIVLWLFRDGPLERLVLWAAITLVVTLVARAVLGRRAVGRIRATALDALRSAGVGLQAVCWGVLPLVVDAAPGRSELEATTALLFPVAIAGLAVAVCAARRTWFEIALGGLLIPPLVWLVAGHPHRPALALALAGFGVALLVVHAGVHRTTERSIATGLHARQLEAAHAADQREVETTAEALEEATKRLDHQSRHDSMTGLLNRRGLLDELDASLLDVEQRGGHVSVLIVDLDRFKVINDSLGHAAGDQLLALSGARLSEFYPTPVILGRLGSDEFVVARRVFDPDPEAAVIAMASTARAAFEQPFQVDAQEISITCSVGGVHGPGQGVSGRDLLRFADAALHHAKAEGKNRYELFDDRLRSALAAQMDEEQALRVALERGEIVPWYQPIVDARTRRIVGAELLARWIPPDGPAVRAGSFITMMHEVGLIERFSEQVIEQGLADLRRWIERGLPAAFRLSVNLPPRYVSRSGRVERLTDLLRSSPCEHLTAEVTETSVVDDLDIAAERLAELRSFGMTIVLDDFGTGSASLSLLQRVPLDGVKIDRSFIVDLTTDDHDRALVGGFLKLAASIDLTVTAEGVETPEQVKALLALGCRRQQGYLHGTAMTADELYAALPARAKRGAPTGA